MEPTTEHLENLKEHLENLREDIENLSWTTIEENESNRPSHLDQMSMETFFEQRVDLLPLALLSFFFFKARIQGLPSLADLQNPAKLKYSPPPAGPTPLWP